MSSLTFEGVQLDAGTKAQCKSLLNLGLAVLFRDLINCSAPWQRDSVLATVGNQSSAAVRDHVNHMQQITNSVLNSGFQERFSLLGSLKGIDISLKEVEE